MKFTEILNILAKYEVDRYPMWMEEGVIGFGVDSTIISEEDMEALTKLGVYYDEQYCSLAVII